MSHSLFDDGFGHHRCCCFFFRLFVFGAQYHVELQPIWMFDCICILLKISHLFSFRHVSTVFWAHFFFWTGQITRFLHFSHIVFFWFLDISFSSFVHRVLFLDVCLFFYQEFSIIYFQFVDFLMDYLPNKTSGGFVTIHGVLCIFCSYSRPLDLTQWTSIELVCGAQLLSAHLDFYLNIMYYSTHSFMLMIAIKENTYINSNEGKNQPITISS